jgi:hypothetical protein
VTSLTREAEAETPPLARGRDGVWTYVACALAINNQQETQA